MEYFVLSFNVISPIIIITMLGYFLKKKSVISDEFTEKVTYIIFKISIPALLFNKITSLKVDLSLNQVQRNFIIYTGLVLILVYLIIELSAKIFIKDIKTRGTYVQGSIRSNYIFIGYPVLLSLFGDEVVFPMILLTLVSLPIFNVTAILTLTINNPKVKGVDVRELLKNIFTNPIILSIIIGFLWSILSFPVPQFLSKTFELVGDVSTPMALIVIGSMFVVNTKGRLNLPLVFTVLNKNIFLPIIFTTAAAYLGFRGVYLGTIFLIFAAPSSTTSFIMAKAMDSNYSLAANIVLASTALSSLVIFLGIVIMKYSDLI